MSSTLYEAVPPGERDDDDWTEPTDDGGDWDDWTDSPIRVRG